MPIFNDTLLTEKGYEAANKAANGQYSFTLTRAVASPRDYRELSTAAMRQLTSLDREFAGKISAQDNVDSKKSKITTKFSNEIEPKGYMANTVGIYAKGDDGKEFLYSVTPSSVGQVIPEQNNNIFSGFQLAIYVIVGNVQNMKVELSPGGDASVDYVDRVVSQAKDDINEILKLKMNRNADGTVPDNANFVNGIQKNGLEVATVKYVDDATINVNVTVLPNNTDLNSVQKTGTYRLLWNYNYLHTPPEAPNGTTFLLEVVNIEDEIYQSIRYSGADGYVNRKLQFGSWTNWLEQATKQYVNEQTAKQFDNSLKAAKDYTDSHVTPNVLDMPIKSMQIGDSFDNYDGKHVHLSIDGLNPFEDIGSGVGLPNEKVYGSFYTIPNANATPEFFQNNLGDRWFRIIGRTWVKVASSGSVTPIVHTNVKYIDLINADVNKFIFNNASATYEPLKKLITLHGSITAKTTVNADDSIFSFAIENLTMNYIASSSLNSQPMTVDTSYTLKDVIGKANAAFNSGQTWNIEGTTITLGYDASLKPKYPFDVSNGYRVALLKDGDNLHNFNTPDKILYYATAGTKLVNSPFDISVPIVMEVSYDSNYPHWERNVENLETRLFKYENGNLTAYRWTERSNPIGRYGDNLPVTSPLWRKF